MTEINGDYYMIERLEPKELEAYLNTEYGQKLESELLELYNKGAISAEEKQLVLAIKAYEYYNYCIVGNAWSCIKYYLENFPELFKIHDLLLYKKPVKKFFYIINSDVESKFEKILYYHQIEFQKHRKALKDVRYITIYIGFLTYPSNYTLEEDPLRKAFSDAEDAGIRIGFHFYDDKEKMKSYYSIALIRSFPIIGDSYGDYTLSGGFREDLKAGFKSSWEANIARILNKQGVTWEYEKASESYATEIGYYIPDFKVDRDGKIHIIEVKGFWAQRSIKKVASAVGQVKDEKIIIIDSDFYSLINTKYKNVILNWEESEVGNQIYELPVVGINIGRRKIVINNLKDNDKLKLIREKNNKYDSNAIKILTLSNEEIGYIAKEWAAIFAFKIDLGFSYEVTLKRKELDKNRVIVKFKTQPAPISLLDNIGF